MESPYEMAMREARALSPEADAIEVQPLGDGIFAVAAYEDGSDGSSCVHVERYFVGISARQIGPADSPVAGSGE